MKKKREPEYGQGMLRMWRQIKAWLVESEIEVKIARGEYMSKKI